MSGSRDQTHHILLCRPAIYQLSLLCHGKTLILEFKHCEKQNVKYPGQDNIFNIYSENLPGMSLCAEKDFVEVE